MPKQTITFAVHTLGCKVNQYESEKIKAELGAIGWDAVAFSAPADIYIINTCTVTAVAGQKSRQLIRRAIQTNDKATVVVTGCYAESDRQAIEAIEGVSLVFGNAEKDQLAKLLAERLASEPEQEPVITHSANATIASARVAPANSIYGARTRAQIKVQDGCDQFCSYCIVPHVRPVLLSRPVSEIVDEVNRLAYEGTREIVLTGIHLGLYGQNEAVDLTGLIKRLLELPELGRIRLSSIELNEITPELIELLKTSPKLCRHLPIPLQSGSNRILKLMNRHYSREEFIEKTAVFKTELPDIALTTDVIVGFPGESEADFVDTVDTIERVGFSRLHVFKYSRRRGTPAADYPGQVPAATKDERSRALITIGERHAAEFAKRFIDRQLRVLIERRKDGLLLGISDNYIRVQCEGPDDIIGSIVQVEAVRQEGAALYGILANERNCGKFE